jgi:hypothetical protein
MSLMETFTLSIKVVSKYQQPNMGILMVDKRFLSNCQLEAILAKLVTCSSAKEVQQYQ